MSSPPSPGSKGSPEAAGVVIPTRNRKDLLRQAIQSSLAQSVPVEVIVLDDASTDGTQQMMREEFSGIRYERFNEPQGPCVLRNRGSELASGPILFPIDDDSVFVSPNTIAQTIEEFDHPRVGAVAIPFVNVRYGPEVRGLAPNDSEIHICSAYIGASHAVRRDLFLRLGGYRPWFFYMGEEGDYCVRMLNAGYVVRIGRGDPLHHFESPLRNLARADFFGRRNDVLYVWHNVPMPYFPTHLAMTTFRGVVFSFRVGRPWRMLRGLASGYLGVLRHWSDRRPIAPSVYRLSRQLKKAGSCRLSEVEAILPPVASK